MFENLFDKRNIEMFREETSFVASIVHRLALFTSDRMPVLLCSIIELHIIDMQRVSFKMYALRTCVRIESMRPDNVGRHARQSNISVHTIGSSAGR